MGQGESELRFRAIYEQNIRAILGYALRRTASADDAADVVADTFLTAWRRIDDAPSGEEARLWLYGVARRTLSNHRRGRRRQDRLADRLRTELAALGTAEWLESLDRPAARTSAAFEAMRKEDKEILTLAVWEDLSSRQIARVLGCSENAAKLRLSRARKRFARSLEQRTDLDLAGGELTASDPEVPR